MIFARDCHAIFVVCTGCAMQKLYVHVLHDKSVWFKIVSGYGYRVLKQFLLMTML